jgi:drug/metabolite transporter (DMT)-like permease
MTGASLQPVAIGLAIVAAATFAVANVVQQRVAAGLRTDTAFDSALLLRLLRRPLWVAGLVLVMVSLALQATALGMGRLVVIEPVLASSLLFALALSARADRRRMRPAEWLAALATFAGLVVFLSVAQPSGGRTTAPPLQLGVAAAAAVVIAVTAVAVSARLSPLRRALTLGISGGIAAGVTDALTKTVAVLIGSHQLGALADPRPYLLVVIGLLTYTLQQNGYRAASLAAFLPAFSVLDPAVGSALGLYLYHEHLGDSPAQIAAEAAAALVAAWGIGRLASLTAQAETLEPVQPVSGLLPLPQAGHVPAAQQILIPAAQMPVLAELPVTALPVLPLAAPVALAARLPEEPPG